LPRPLELAARLLFATMLCGGLAYACRFQLATAAVPAIRAAIAAIATDFQVLGLEVSRDDSQESLRLRANLAHPVRIAGRTLYPFGWAHGTSGWMEVRLTLGGMLSHALLLVIVAVAWPFRTFTEFVVRMTTATVSAALLLVINACSTFHAELRNLIVDTHPDGTVSFALAWSRFLMGGGGFAIAIVLAAFAIALARGTVGWTQGMCSGRVMGVR